jgi:DNA repair protein SbcC/Rad50
MRMVAVRGENLASLAGVFEVDLDAEPIRSAGIFAITGPTGAGKTTLLDALCLALFDRLPRMDTAEKGALIGRVDGDSGQQAKYDDVRGILRHGAGAGYAEVDFIGQDGRRYRSRWEVNRARRRANGRLQDQKITLTDLQSGTVIGDKKVDTLQQIEKRIGLSFDQFRRSVLLAQGDFDTFIRAGSRDRAELLERITGTEIYAQISQAAFARAKEEREALRALEGQLSEHQPLTDDARDAAEARVYATRAEVERVEADMAALDKAQNWYEAKSRLDTRLAEGETVLTQAMAADQAAEADRTALAVALKAFSLRAELESAVAAGKKLADVERALADASTAEREAIEGREQAITASNCAKAESDAARAAYDAIGADLDRAKALDAKIDAATRDVADSDSLLARKASEKDAASQALAEVEAALQSARARHANDLGWLAEHQAVEALSVRSEDVAKDLSEVLTLERELASTRQQAAHLDRAVHASWTAVLGTDAELATLQLRERDLDESIATLRQVSEAINLPGVEGRRDAMMTIHAALDDAQNAAEDAARAQSAVRTAAEEKARQELIIRQASAVIDAVDAALPLATARLEEARRGLDLSEAAGSEHAEYLRLKLVDGQPCPVCGATEHPVTGATLTLRNRLTADRRRVAELEEEVSAARADRTRADTQIAAANDALEGIARRQSGYELELRTAQGAWRTAIATVRQSCDAIDLIAPAFAEDPTAGENLQSLRLLRERVETALREAKESMSRASDAEAEARKLTAQRDGLRARILTARDAIQKLKDEAHAKAGEAATLRGRLQGMEQNLAAAYGRLDMAVAAVFPDWRQAVSNLGARFAAECRGLVDEWRACRQRAETARGEISRLEADLQGKRATLMAAEAATAEAARQLSAKRRDLENLAAVRLTVIGGRPAGDVRTEYQQRLVATENAWHAAEMARTAAEQHAVAMASRVVASRQACEAARSAHASAERLLDDKLALCEITRAQAEAAIDKGEAWMAAEQSRLDALRDEVTKATATLAAIQESAREHEAVGRPALSREDIAAALSDVKVRHAQASEAFIAARAVIINDDQARARIAEIQATLDARREKARVWGQLDELIGSADGAKFRRFAQSLTLNHLIQLANRHLADLHPRYELQRAPGGDLVLQVIDHNMADEVRGVHNLSGGERFLVSLALALGLASMASSRGVKVESLFIDEGFGALDSTSLAMAVSVLEQLQATGRQVGVISHVDELKERIAVKVEVSPVGGGRSKIRVCTS